VKKLIALALVAGFLAVGSIGCNKETKKDTGGAPSKAGTPAGDTKK
jgi:hypothetical protein